MEAQQHIQSVAESFRMEEIRKVTEFKPVAYDWSIFLYAWECSVFRTNLLPVSSLYAPKPSEASLQYSWGLVHFWHKCLCGHWEYLGGQWQQASSEKMARCPSINRKMEPHLTVFRAKGTSHWILLLVVAMRWAPCPPLPFFLEAQWWESKP